MPLVIHLNWPPCYLEFIGERVLNFPAWSTLLFLVIEKKVKKYFVCFLGLKWNAEEPSGKWFSSSALSLWSYSAQRHPYFVEVFRDNEMPEKLEPVFIWAVFSVDRSECQSYQWVCCGEVLRRTLQDCRCVRWWMTNPKKKVKVTLTLKEFFPLPIMHQHNNLTEKLLSVADIQNISDLTRKSCSQCPQAFSAF